MSIFTRLTASRHYGHDDMKLLDKHIDYENTRAPAYRCIIKVGKELQYFKNLTLAREYVRDNLLTVSQRKKLYDTQMGYDTTVNHPGTRKVVRRQKITSDLSKGITQPVIKKVPSITITMVVKDQRVKIDCPTTKEAIAILKGI